MPLSATALSALLKTELDGEFPLADHPDAESTRQNYCDKMADAIITHIVAANVVNVTTAMGPGIGKAT